MENQSKVKPEIVHDFTEEKKGRDITINKADKDGFLIIHVRGSGKMNIKREEFIVFKRNKRITKFLITDIKYFKNKNFRAELIFIKWLD